MNNTNDLLVGEQNDVQEGIDIGSIFRKIKDKWIWLAAGLIICMAAAYFYMKFAEPIYKIESKVLINDDAKGGGNSGQSNALMDFGGLLGGKSSIDNEVEILKTRFLMEQVVRKMQLNIIYKQLEGIGKREVYRRPFVISILRGIDTIRSTTFNVKILDANSYHFKSKKFDKTININEKFEVPGIGLLKISADSSLIVKPNGGYEITIMSIDDRVSGLMNQLTVAPANKQASIIELNFNYPNSRKGEDILNTLIDQYISSNIEDKNIVADSTTKFIKERLNIIGGELGDVENKVQDFKQGNKLADMSEQGKLLVQNTSEFATELAKAETQVKILNDLEQYLTDREKNRRVFPTSLLPSDMVFSGLMSQYNSLLIEKDKLLLSNTEESPFIKNIDEQIKGLRDGILSNVKSTKNTYIVTRNTLRGQLSKVENQISSVPKIEKDYLKLARNQQIKQELYIFLMQKAEETAISKTSNVAIAKVIDPPKSIVGPVGPKRNIIYLGGFCLGLILPLGLILIENLFNDKIETKENLTSLTRVPIIGEISHNNERDNLIVVHKGRSAISEQFRALRTNLSFYLKRPEDKVILLTSSMSGEGKSFTAINLGSILALAGKKVVLMELDLRKPGLSVKLNVNNDIGFTNYTIDPSITVDQILKPLPINKNMFIIASGPLPPNPAETLMSDKMTMLIDKLKADFDYIIMDAPPVGIITDAQLLATHADATIYVVRQKVTSKKQIAIVEDLYRKSKMKNLGIVVNDIVEKYYGYGYGYGNYDVQDEEGILKKFLQKFKSN